MPIGAARSFSKQSALKLDDALSWLNDLAR